MAAQNLYDAEFSSPQGPVTMTVTYDDVTLKVLAINYANPSAQPGQLVLTGVINQTITTPAASTRTIDLTPANVTCVATTFVNRFGQQVTEVALPGGETASFTWPA